MKKEKEHKPYRVSKTSAKRLIKAGQKTIWDYIISVRKIKR